MRDCALSNQAWGDLRFHRALTMTWVLDLMGALTSRVAGSAPVVWLQVIATTEIEMLSNQGLLICVEGHRGRSRTLNLPVV